MSFYEFAATHPWLSSLHAILAIVGLATVGGEIRRAVVKLARVQAGRAARLHEMSLAAASAAKDDTEDEPAPDSTPLETLRANDDPAGIDRCVTRVRWGLADGERTFHVAKDIADDVARAFEGEGDEWTIEIDTADDGFNRARMCFTRNP